MFRKECTSILIVAILLTGFPSSSASTPQEDQSTVLVPIGTKIYCQLDQLVESKKKLYQVGDKVRVTVWRDVVIGGQVVIRRGTPVNTHISLLQKAKIAGRKGKLELSADEVRLGNGEEIPLVGGYGKQGKGRIALSVALFALVAWPLIFLTGKYRRVCLDQ